MSDMNKLPIDESVTSFFEEKLGKRIDMVCDVHGKYNGYEKVRDCPECMHDKEDETRHKEERERNQLFNRQRWERAGMPSKFCGITIKDWPATTDDMLVAKEAAKLFVTGGVKRMLFIGNCGTGKTMLAAGTIGKFTEEGKSPVYITAARLIRTIRESWVNKTSEQDAMDIFIKADVLVIDELGNGVGSENEKLLLSEILCDRYGSEKPTLLISNLTAEELKEFVLDERAVDRMREDGQVITMNWESFRTNKGE